MGVAMMNSNLLEVEWVGLEYDVGDDDYCNDLFVHLWHNAWLNSHDPVAGTVSLHWLNSLNPVE